jgi:hypothetical protein
MICDSSLVSLLLTVYDFQPDGDDELRVKDAEKACLEARAKYILKNSIIENILITDPVLKAIHSGGNATPAERFLCLLC